MQELLAQVKHDVLTRANVIGITTTATAMQRDLISAIRPSIMIVEEAAEILESQLLSCLANVPVQQIILIGDHKQLKPTVWPSANANSCTCADCVQGLDLCKASCTMILIMSFMLTHSWHAT